MITDREIGKIKYIPELFAIIGKEKSRNNKKHILRVFSQDKNKALTLKKVIEGAFHPSINWKLPEGNPPYTDNPSPDYNLGCVQLNKVLKKLYQFLECDSMIQNDMKRESLFVKTLESVYKDDAKLLLMMKNGNFEYSGITKKLFEDTFPEYFPSKKENKGFIESTTKKS